MLAHALCGTKRALVGALGNAPFASLIVFCLVVPVLTYAALPLTLSVASVHAWTHARAARPVDPPDAKMPRLAADAAYHRAQHELLKARVEELEAELEVTRASAQKGRDFHSSRISALAKRCEDLEKDRDRELL